MTPFFKTSLDKANHARFCLQSGYPVWIRFENGTIYCVFATEYINDRQLAYLNALPNTSALVSRAWRLQKAETSLPNWMIVKLPLTKDLNKDDIAQYLDPLTNGTKTQCSKVEPADLEDFETILSLCRRFQILPVIMVTEHTPDNTAVIVDKADIEALLSTPVDVQAVSSATVPVAGRPDARLQTFRVVGTQEEHYALICGDIDAKNTPPIVRIHSACMTGDIFGSLKCDCGPQLDAALKEITNSDTGILVYLMQEGRGIGLINKMRAYSLQEQGHDTVDANHALGFEDDERDFSIGAAILKSLNADTIQLLTNNPRKVNGLSERGITVTQRLPLAIEPNKYNAGYLSTKASKSGHLL
jgi:GTP cyclohydrolase II